MADQGTFDFDACVDCGERGGKHRPTCPKWPVLNSDLAQQVTEAGVARVEAHVASEMADAMRLVVAAVARRQPFLTSDDIWATARMLDVDLSQANPSALGGAFRSVARDGLILLTDERRESQRPPQHRKPLRVWRSLVYQKAG
jgi:hypothetical protein